MNIITELNVMLYLVLGEKRQTCSDKPHSGSRLIEGTKCDCSTKIYLEISDVEVGVAWLDAMLEF